MGLSLFADSKNYFETVTNKQDILHTQHWVLCSFCDLMAYWMRYLIPQVYCQGSNKLRERSSVRVKQLRARDPGKAGPGSSAPLTVCLLPLSTGKSYIVPEIILKLWKNLIFWLFGSGFLTSCFGLGNFFLSKTMYICINYLLELHTKLMCCWYVRYICNKSRLRELMFLSLCFDWQLNDNSEALAHQRLATKMLAAKMKEMEKCGNTGDSQTV